MFLPVISLFFSFLLPTSLASETVEDAGKGSQDTRSSIILIRSQHAHFTANLARRLVDKSNAIGVIATNLPQNHHELPGKIHLTTGRLALIGSFQVTRSLCRNTMEGDF